MDNAPADAAWSTHKPAVTMPKKLIRRYLPTPKDLRAYASLRYALGGRLHDPDVWHLNRRSASGAVAVGLLIAWVPLPVQMVVAALLALLLRVNLPLSVIAVWVSNPLTMGPMYWFAWRLGRWLLDEPYVPVQFEPTFAWLTAEIGMIWQPLGLGCLLLGIVSAALGYVVTRLFWRYHVIRTLLLRRRHRATSRNG